MRPAPRRRPCFHVHDLRRVNNNNNNKDSLILFCLQATVNHNIIFRAFIPDLLLIWLRTKFIWHCVQPIPLRICQCSSSKPCFSFTRSPFLRIPWIEFPFSNCSSNPISVSARHNSLLAGTGATAKSCGGGQSRSTSILKRKEMIRSTVTVLPKLVPQELL